MENVAIINTGGTFNKYYNLDRQRLEVLEDNSNIQKIIQKTFYTNNFTQIFGSVYKDSSHFTTKDREQLVSLINKLEQDKIIIVHGTDTIIQTAQFLKDNEINKTIILTGSMVPFSINEIEASSNLMTAYGYIQAIKEKNIYIALNGLVEEFNKVYKNKEEHCFKRISND